LYYTAAGESAEAELLALTEAVAACDLPDREAFLEDPPGNWTGALRQLASILPDDRASIVVLDEVPYLMDRIDAFEGILQRAWDRELCRKPVLLILIGSDLSMMEALTSYGRPFHQRGQEMVLGPLSPADIAKMTGLAPAEAIDAALITGGLPLLCAHWPKKADMWTYLDQQLTDPLSPLLVSGERSIAAEFPADGMARSVLQAIGHGERNYRNIIEAAGISAGTFTKAIGVLEQKRIIAAELPVSLTPSKERRYRVTDPYLRFWFSFVRPHIAEIERGRGDLTVERVRAGWTSWRGRAVEPLVRESLARLLPAKGIDPAAVVGGYWTRSNDVEIDLVGADRAPVARQLRFLGSIKWLEKSAFDGHDLAALQKHRHRLTDDPVPLIAVSRSGVKTTGLAAAFGPTDLLDAWKRRS
jgi:AAA+ ATPase superfamily predicted ATPase